MVFRHRVSFSFLGFVLFICAIFHFLHATSFRLHAVGFEKRKRKSNAREKREKKEKAIIKKMRKRTYAVLSLAVLEGFSLHRQRYFRVVRDPKCCSELHILCRLSSRTESAATCNEISNQHIVSQHIDEVFPSSIIFPIISNNIQSF